MYLNKKTHVDVLYSQNVETFLGGVLYEVGLGCPSPSYGAWNGPAWISLREFLTQ